MVFPLRAQATVPARACGDGHRNLRLWWWARRLHGAPPFPWVHLEGTNKAGGRRGRARKPLFASSKPRTPSDLAKLTLPDENASAPYGTSNTWFTKPMSEKRAPKLDFYEAGEEVLFRQMVGFGGAVALAEKVAARNAAVIASAEATGDDRSLVLVGAMLIEQDVESLLRILIPGYNKLVEHNNFTFSMKILLLRSFKAIPNRLILLADGVRNLRNTFAHDLSGDNLISLSTTKHLAPIRSLRGTLIAIGADVSEADNRAVVKAAIVLATTGMAGFIPQMQRLNDFLRSPRLAPALSAMDAEA